MHISPQQAAVRIFINSLRMFWLWYAANSTDYYCLRSCKLFYLGHDFEVGGKFFFSVVLLMGDAHFVEMNKQSMPIYKMTIETMTMARLL